MIEPHNMVSNTNKMLDNIYGPFESIRKLCK